jgi:hypothetical protein
MFERLYLKYKKCDGEVERYRQSYTQLLKSKMSIPSINTGTEIMELARSSICDSEAVKEYRQL